MVNKKTIVGVVIGLICLVVFALFNPFVEVKDNFYCEEDSDCILTVFEGCDSFCPKCKTYSIDDEAVIAVNKNWDADCESQQVPEDLICIECIDIYDFDLEEDAICINKLCEKRL